MSQSGYTPIQHYKSTTPSAVPVAGNLLPGELAVNIADSDMAVYMENASGVVKRVINNPAGLTYPTADGTADQVIKTDGAGNLSFTSAAASADQVSYDNTTSGLPDTDVQAAIDTLSVAAGVTYDNSTSGLTATNVQAAVDELATASTTLDSYYFQSYQMTGGNDVSVDIYTGSADATERRTLNIPPMLVNIDGETYTSASGVTKDLNTSANWDSATYATASNRNGKDFYLYACVPSSGTAPDFVLSANSTYPTGYTADDSRKVGGCHCLGVSVGTISGHDLTGYITGDILPRSVWDLDHRSSSVNEGFVYGKNNKWVGIYLPSVSGGELVSVYGGTIADGASSEVFHSYKFEQWFGRIGQGCIDQSTFIAAAIGANQSTNISARPTRVRPAGTPTRQAGA